MALFPIALPPGLARNGTELEAAGRYYDADLVRWPHGSLEPIGGVRLKADQAVEGRARAIRVWTANDGQAFVAVGTHTQLYAMDRAGVLYAITPEDFTPGLADSDFRGGYGNDLYGVGMYGTPRTDTTTPSDVTVWSLDTFGQDLIACTADDGVIYRWSLNTAAPAEPLAGAPTARAVAVSAERMVMALGAGGNPRRVDWSDQEDAETWTPATTNYAGSFTLQSAGRLMCGRRVRGGMLLLTDADVWLARFLGQPLVYGFSQTGGAGTGIVAQGAAATLDGEAVPASAAWMGPEGFFAFNGFVQPLGCEIAGDVFGDINRTQISKVSAWHNAEHGEVWWFYPSASSTECDRAAVWDYRGDAWTHHRSLIGTCGAERGALAFPLAATADGFIYEREVGLDYLGAEPFAETGPIVLGAGESVMRARALIPDVETLGDVEAQVFGRARPTGAEVDLGTYALSAKTDVRFSARYLRLRIKGARLARWKVGRFALDLAADGRR